VNLPTVGFSGSFCEQSLQFSGFQAVFVSAVWCEPFCLRLTPRYLAQHASRIVQAGVSGLDHGGQSLPLRQKFSTGTVKFQTKEGFRTKTGKSHIVPLERALADKWRRGVRRTRTPARVWPGR
jgi:hypothetical protein